jgi:hypothetical protein
MTKTPKRSGDLANGETSEGEPTPPTSRDSVANALDRWDEEGGAPAVPWPLPYEAGDLLENLSGRSLRINLDDAL